MRIADSPRTLLVVLAGLVLAACAGDAPPSPGATTGPATGAATGEGIATPGSWVLTAATIDGEQLTLPDDARVDLVPTDDGIGGRAACNQYFGSATIDGTAISFGQLGQTEMGCMPPLMEIESAYLAALDRVTSFTRDGDGLTLSGDGVELTFAEELPAPDEDLVGVRWELDSLVTGDAVSSVSGDGFLELAEDGTFVGATGCRVLEGEWVRTGATVTFTSMSANGECDPDLAQQDDHVVAVLEAFTVALEGDRLTVTSTQGDGAGLVYRAAA